MSKHIIVLFLFLGISSSLFAQRITYRDLVMRTQAPTIFIDELILPGNGNDGKTNLAFIFRFNNDFIPYKKIPVNHQMNVPNGAEFYATIRLNAEIFEGKLKRRQEPSANSVSRDSWTDTLFTSTFEETQSDELYASGALSMQLALGNYNYMMQLTMMQERNERNTQRRNVKVPDFSTKKTGEVYLIRHSKQNGESQVLELMNMDRNVPFGEDFYALIRIPNYEASAEYIVEVNRAKISRKDTTSGASIFSAALSATNVFQNSTVTLNKRGYPSLKLTKGNHPYTYTVISIPASSFENAPYLLSLTKKDNETPAAHTFFKSYWPDMPASLYNLDVSIKMLKYIASEKEIDRIDSGNKQEKEKKFRAFWEKRDPTPNTVYNELMAEYYRRIDYAYKEFGSQENPMGHESDQGEIYIKFGPPDNKERRFPANGQTIEVWEYPNRTFVFEATTGFGDFVLVATR